MNADNQVRLMALIVILIIVGLALANHIDADKLILCHESGANCEEVDQ